MGGSSLTQHFTIYSEFPMKEVNERAGATNVSVDIEFYYLPVLFSYYDRQESVCNVFTCVSLFLNINIIST